MKQSMRRRLLLLLILFLWPAAAPAAVEIAFYSKDFGSSFPHAFVVLKGTLDETGAPVDASFGFTLRRQVGPSVLMGPVGGQVISETPAYIAKSDRHFTLLLTDDQYRAVEKVVRRWQALPQPSYDLNSRNCVFFVAEVAAAIGLKAVPDGKLMKKPKAFLQKVTRDNLGLIAGRAPATFPSSR